MERHFKITVRGHLSIGFADLFGDVTMSMVDDATVIAGVAIDQSGLEGILAHLRDLGLEMIAIETRSSVAPRPTSGTDEMVPG